MCGISGFIDATRSTSRDELAAIASRMARTVLHRGPDDSGTWVDERAGVALGHRRLSVIDLSEHGHQPMTSRDGRFVVAYNGEIYNFPELRSRLEAAGCRFRGHSDTEVLTEALSAWGIERLLAEANGMFAFAAWDTAERRLSLARDRFGEKPLYYGWTGNTFLFASEVRALRQHPTFNAEVDREAVALFLRHNYVPAPWSVFSGISKLPPGTWLTVDPFSRSLAEPEQYWSVRGVASSGIAARGALDEHEAIERLDALLRESVRLRMVADVPVGAFLSGGIDSSTVVALMQDVAAQPVRTFTVGFDEASHDEAVHARAVASHLGTEHTEVRLTPCETLDVVPRLASIYDEPFADSSQIPMFLVSSVARRDVTVALSGDGGDELFGGYLRYRLSQRLWRSLRPVPVPVRARVAAAVRRVPPESWDRVAGSLLRVLPRRLRQQQVGDKVHKLAGVVASRDLSAAYQQLISHWNSPEELVLGVSTTPGSLPPPLHGGTGVDWMMYADATTYLPDDILVKLDRATMAVSLEGRVPLLDHHVAEFAWSLPLDMKVRGATTKWLLRRVLEQYVPASLFDRPKMGFGVPIGTWLRGPLRDWAEDLLSESSLTSSGLLDPEPVRRRWEDHVACRRDWKYALWGVLMLESWLREQSPSERP